MKKSELDGLSVDELNTLKIEVEKALIRAEERRKNAALDAMQRAAKEHGFSVEDLLGGASQTKKARKEAKARPVRYINPDNREETWSGFGRQPGWFKDKVESGMTKEAMEV